MIKSRGSPVKANSGRSCCRRGDEGEEGSEFTYTVEHDLTLRDANIFQNLLVAQGGGFG